MKKYHDLYVIGIDHGYGNMKTANCCFPTGVLKSETEPVFTGDLLVWDGHYYSIGVGHKEFTADIDKAYLETVVSAAKEYTAGIFRRLREHEYDPKLMKLYVVGGGGCLIRNFADYDSSRVFINEDICVTAKGYEYMALMTLKRNGGAV